MEEQLYTWSGHYFGYREGDDLWTYEGRHVGKFYGNEVFDPEGRYLGEIRNGYYLIRDSRKMTVIRGRFTPREKRPETVKHLEHMGFVVPSGYQDFPKI